MAWVERGGVVGKEECRGLCEGGENSWLRKEKDFEEMRGLIIH